MQNERKNPLNKNLSLGQAVLLILAAVTAVFLLLNFTTTVSVAKWVFDILSPLLIGICIAFVVNILMVALEERIFGALSRFKFWQRIKRTVCILLSFFIFGAIIALLFFLIVPQLQESIMTLSKNMPVYIQDAQYSLNALLQKYNLNLTDMLNFEINWQSILEYVSKAITHLTPQVANMAASITSGMFDFLMGIFFALYLLFSKEKLFKNINDTIRAFGGEERAKRASQIGALTNKVFRNFVVGQLTEALILGVLYFITASIFKMPHALLLSVIMAIGGLIPMFGPIIATVPCVFILLMVNPASAPVFVIMAIVIQQLEGNFIYPFVVGDSIGLPAIWVLLAVLVGGSLFGAIGMVLAVPVVSVFYTLLRQSVNERLAAVQKPQPPKPKNEAK